MDSTRRLATPILVVGLFLIVVPIIDFVGNVWPLRPGAVDWRYGAIGILSTFLLTPILGLVLVSVSAHATERRWLLRVVSLTSFAAGIALIVIIVAFALDAVQVRQSRAVDERWVTVVSFIIASAKHGLATICLLVLGVSTHRAAKDFGHLDKKADRSATVVVGRT